MLYEMATGKKAFEAKSQAALIAAILKEEPPPMRELQPMTPLLLEHIVKTCLVKDPDDRPQSAHDLKLELEWIRESSGISDIAKLGVESRRRAAKLRASLLPLARWRSWARLCLHSVQVATAPMERLEFQIPFRKKRATWHFRLMAACWRSCHPTKPPAPTC